MFLCRFHPQKKVHRFNLCFDFLIQNFSPIHAVSGVGLSLFCPLSYFAFSPKEAQAEKLISTAMRKFMETLTALTPLTTQRADWRCQWPTKTSSRWSWCLEFEGNWHRQMLAQYSSHWRWFMLTEANWWWRPLRYLRATDTASCWQNTVNTDADVCWLRLTDADGRQKPVHGDADVCCLRLTDAVGCWQKPVKRRRWRISTEAYWRWQWLTKIKSCWHSNFYRQMRMRADWL